MLKAKEKVDLVLQVDKLNIIKTCDCIQSYYV